MLISFTPNLIWLSLQGIIRESAYTICDKNLIVKWCVQPVRVTIIVPFHSKKVNQLKVLFHFLYDGRQR